MGFLKRYARKYWRPFLAAIAFLMVEAGCDLMQPTIMSKVVDVGVAGKDMQYVLRMGAIMLLMTAVGAAAAVCRNIISSNVSQKFGTELRSDLFKKIHSYSFENIDRFETASLVTRLTNDVSQVQGFVHGLMRIFVKAPLLCLGSVVMAVLLNPRMALILVIVIPVIAMIIFLNMKAGLPFFMKVQKALDRVNGVMREYLAGVRVVKAFNRFEYEMERFAGANQELASASITAMRVMALFSPGITLIVNMGIVTVLLLGGYRVNNGDIRVGQIIAFTNYMTQILFSLMMISFVFTMFVRARASAERIGEAMAQESTMTVPESPVRLESVRGQVDYHAVAFSYTGSLAEPVLKDITFSCRSGETLGIIGSTGSGKSTLVSLLPRFYDPLAGSVRVDGIDIRELDTRMLREQIAVVPQKSMLFTGTILDNIRWGRENASEDEIREAARAAQAHDFIAAFPEGYQTLLGQGGVNLSGGQKQRVAIARALVRKPRILILDDCTSAVDVITEAKIRQAVRDFGTEPVTCIIIAQRITSVMAADSILVLDNGEMAGMGTHEELLRTCSIYQDIYRSQIGKEAI